MLTVTVQHDAAQRRFYATLPDGSEAELQYSRSGNTLIFVHTYVPDAYRTQGVAEQVVSAGFRYAKQQGSRVTPSCPYVGGAFLRRHPQYKSLIAA